MTDIRAKLRDRDYYVHTTYTEDLASVLNTFGDVFDNKRIAERTGGKDTEAAKLWLLKEISISLRTLVVIMDEFKEMMQQKR